MTHLEAQRWFRDLINSDIPINSKSDKAYQGYYLILDSMTKEDKPCQEEK